MNDCQRTCACGKYIGNHINSAIATAATMETKNAVTFVFIPYDSKSDPWGCRDDGEWGIFAIGWLFQRRNIDDLSGTTTG
jgi:hypothetical protein